MKREYPEHPIVGVAAIIFDGQKVLLARRNKEPGRGEWNLPGGAVELGETLEQALSRELMEEVSVEVRLGGLVGVFSSIFRDRLNAVKYHYTIVDYWAWIVSGRPKPGSDISELKWAAIDEIENLSIGTDLKKAILKADAIRCLFLDGRSEEYIRAAENMGLNAK